MPVSLGWTLGAPLCSFRWTPESSVVIRSITCLMTSRIVNVMSTSSRLLKLLSLLQTPRDWSGSELADRLEVSPRTVRNDVERLRALGDPVHATRGRGGGFPLGGA